MIKKINIVKCWLQMFGDRDNETFHKSLIFKDKELTISLQYSYDFDGDELEPYIYYSYSFKNYGPLNKFSSEELDELIIELKKNKTIW